MNRLAQFTDWCIGLGFKGMLLYWALGVLVTLVLSAGVGATAFVLAGSL